MTGLTDWVALATGLVVLATAVTTWRRVARVARNVQEVHVLVNANMREVKLRVEQLTEALQGSDTAVPPAPPTQGGNDP